MTEPWVVYAGIAVWIGLGGYLAFLAASLAREALRHLSRIILASVGCSSRNAIRFSLVEVSTKPLTSLFPSFALVCPSN